MYLKYMPARLDKVIYDAWIAESPKRIEGGTLGLTLCKGHGEEDDAWNLDARKVSTTVLGYPNAENLYIMGSYDKYDGFKIYVNIKNKIRSMDKFLLMGHQHHLGPYMDNGVNLGDHPHFHQIEYSKNKTTGKRSSRKTHELHPLLFNGMDSEQFLKAFLKRYYFDHLRDGDVRKLTEKQFQSELGEFVKKSVDSNE